MKKPNIVFKKIYYIFLIVIFFYSVFPFLTLNFTSLKLIKPYFNNNYNHDFSIYTDNVEKNDNHYYWLIGMFNYNRGNKSTSKVIFVDLIAHSFFYPNILELLFPNDLDIAEEALQEYPKSTKMLYWVARSLEDIDRLSSQKYYKQIIALDIDEGNAWRYMGNNYEILGMLDEALATYLYACNLGDVGESSCYNAGRMLENKKQYSDALACYNKSKLDISRQRENLLIEKEANEESK